MHRQFVRRVVIPEGIKKETIKCDLDENGRLSICATRNGQPTQNIPIDFKKTEEKKDEKTKKWAMSKIWGWRIWSDHSPSIKYYSAFKQILLKFQLFLPPLIDITFALFNFVSSEHFQFNKIVWFFFGSYFAILVWYHQISRHPDRRNDDPEWALPKPKLNCEFLYKKSACRKWLWIEIDQKGGGTKITLNRKTLSIRSCKNSSM